MLNYHAYFIYESAKNEIKNSPHNSAGLTLEIIQAYVLEGETKSIQPQRKYF